MNVPDKQTAQKKVLADIVEWQKHKNLYHLSPFGSSQNGGGKKLRQKRLIQGLLEKVGLDVL